jgi:integrase/recombinase XerD
MNTQTLSPYVVRPGPRSRYRQLPFIGPILDSLLAWLRGQGYSEWTINNYLKALGPLARWLRKRRHDALNEDDLRAAYDYFHDGRPDVAAACRALGRFLSAHQLIRAERPKSISRSEVQIQIFDSHLREVRGLAAMTVTGHLGRIRIFLQFLKFDKCPAAIRTLNLDRIEAFLRQAARTNNRFSLQHIVASLRAFLRHQFTRGCLREPLYEQIDMPRTYRLERLPRALPWNQVVALLRSIDQSTPGGLRDFTLLYLAACYGLRSGELVRLMLDDIDWRAGTLKVVQTKTKQALVLPLTDEAGQILVRYLQTGRPQSQRRELFLRRRAPAGALAPTAVHDILAHRIALSGLDLPSVGSHVLRHSLAVDLLRRGVSLPTIGATLGHRDVESTAVYLRLNLDDLREVGLPVPEGANATEPYRKGWKEKLVPARSFRRVRLSRAGFHSGLAASLRRYLAIKRALGRAFRNEEDTLRQWDDFLWRHFGKAREIKPQMFQRWAQAIPATLCPTVRRNRLRIVRNFLLYYARRHPRTHIPDPSTFPKPIPHQTPRLVSPAEMARVLATATLLPSSHQNPIRSATIRLALILLYCCGLRRGELLRLRMRHFDPQQNVLHVENTKFHKSRLVPLPDSVAEEVRRYLALRQRQRLPTDPEDFLLWSQDPRARQCVYSAPALANNWQLLCLTVGVLDGRGRPPRLHDLRHSFAVEALQRWYRQGGEVPSKLVHLATYLGHVSPTYTHHYVYLSPDLQQAANRLFYDYAQSLFTPEATNETF